MPHTADPDTSKETQDTPGFGASSPPPYAMQEQQPPPYSAAPPMNPQPKPENICVYQPTDLYESSHDACPEAPADIFQIFFDDKTVRKGFIRKVFSILTVQLLFTFSVVCVFTFSSAVKEAVQNNFWVYISSYIIFLVVIIIFSCSQRVSRRHPWNIVGLAMVTLSLSYMVGTVASFHDTNTVVITMGTTLAISLAIIAFSAQTRFDFTICHSVFLVLVVDLLMFGFFCTFYYSIIGAAFGCLGALLYSLFMIIDCQLLMGKMGYWVDPELYINVALKIYLDIILIFVYLLGRT